MFLPVRSKEPEASTFVNVFVLVRCPVETSPAVQSKPVQLDNKPSHRPFKMLVISSFLLLVAMPLLLITMHLLRS